MLYSIAASLYAELLNSNEEGVDIIIPVVRSRFAYFIIFSLFTIHQTLL